MAHKMSMSAGSALYLKVTGCIWSGYGAWCFLYPLYTVEKFFGLQIGGEVHWGVEPEIAAMYGGLQFAVGANGLYAALYDSKNLGGTISTLRSFWFAMGALGMFRLAAVLRAGRSVAPALTLRVLTEGIKVLLPEFYNANAIWFFEIPGAMAAYVLMQREMKRLRDSETKNS